MYEWPTDFFSILPAKHVFFEPKNGEMNLEQMTFNQ